MIYIAVTIVMGILAINGGNNLHYLAAAMMLGYMLASGVVGRRNLMRANASLRVPDEIYAGAQALLEVEIRNEDRLAPLFLISARVGDCSVFFPIVLPGEAARKSSVFTLPTRGENILDESGEMEISSVYPFNFFTRYRQIELAPNARKIIVFPRPIDDGGARFIDESESDAAGVSPVSDAESDIVGVRPYVEGDPMRRIHWKSSARTGRLNTRVYDSSSGSGRIIDLDAMTANGPERALSEASHELAVSIRSGEPMGILDDGVLYPPSPERADKLAMLTRLALHE
jgi:uncharacterized protein (DUF58 family)